MTRREGISPELEALLELRQVLTNLSKDWGSMAQFFRAAAEGATLHSGTIRLDANGMHGLSFSVPYAALSIANFGTTTLTVSSDGAQAAAPTGRAEGAFHVPAGAFATRNMIGRHVQLYGSPGAVVDVLVHVRPQPTAGGALVAASLPATNWVQQFPADGGPTPGLANAVYNGPWHDTGNLTAAAGGGWSKFRALAFSDVAGTLNVQQSNDGATLIRTTLSQAFVVNNPAQALIVESIVTRRFVRAQFVVGGANQGVFDFDTALVAI